MRSVQEVGVANSGQRQHHGDRRMWVQHLLLLDLGASSSLQDMERWTTVINFEEQFELIDERTRLAGHKILATFRR